MWGRHKKAMLEAGARAPSFRLKGLDGAAVSLDEILAKGPALLAFYKISCPVCQLTFPYLERLAAGSPIQIIGISQDDASATEGFNQRFGVTFPTLLDQAKDRLSGQQRVRHHQRSHAVSGGTGWPDRERVQRILEARFGGPGRTRRREAVPGGRECAGMEGWLRLEKLRSREDLR